MMSRVGLNLRASAYLHQGDRKYMEDEFQVAYQRSHDKKDIEYAFFGIFDGHGGKEAAHFAKDNLMDNIVSQRLFWSENDEDVLCAIKEGFLQTHMAMWKELDQWPRTASGWPSTSGTTASIAFIRRQKIYIGHVGDSGIVLGKNLGGCDHSGGNEWFGIYLTRDHKPESVLEMNRITECGGKVIAKSGVPRVVWNRPKFGHQGPVRRSTPMDEIPFLAVARSLGDLWSYNASNNQFVVSPEPDVCVFDIDINHHRCLIFGTDGLWNALSPSQAVNIAYNSEKNNEKHYLGVPMGCGKQRLWINPSRCIVSGALERYQLVNLRADNTSAVTVYLDPPGRPKREVLLQQLSMKKGSQSKNASPKSPSKKLKEASVNVHVHNQPSSTEGNRGILWIKERLPEGKPNRTSTSPPLVIPHHSWPGSLSSSSVSSATREDSRESRTGAEENSNATSACSECGCTKRSSPGHTNTNLSTSIVDLNCKPVPSNCNGTPDNHCISGTAKASSGSSNKNDDIQIPLVSSSTYIEGSEDDREISASAPASIKPPYRRTRSCVSHSATDCNENKKDITHQPTASSTSSSTSGSKLHLAPPSLPPTYQTDTSHRVLKNINRGSSCLKVDSNSSSGLISTKRKRARDILHQEERSSKSLRVHTRSHTMRSKPMITRSQGKTNVQRRSL